MVVLDNTVEASGSEPDHADLYRLREAFRDPRTGALRGFGPQPPVEAPVFPLFTLGRPITAPPMPEVIEGELSCRETRLLNVFKALSVRPGQSVAASMLWASWRMFGAEADIWDTVDRLKQRRLVVVGEGRGGLSLTDAGFATLASL